MRKLIQYGSKLIGFLILGFTAFLLFMSSFLRVVSENGITYDGLGRQLNENMRHFLPWPIIDWVILFGLIGLAILMFKLSNKYKVEK